MSLREVTKYLTNLKKGLKKESLTAGARSGTINADCEAENHVKNHTFSLINGKNPSYKPIEELRDRFSRSFRFAWEEPNKKQKVETRNFTGTKADSFPDSILYLVWQ